MEFYGVAGDLDGLSGLSHFGLTGLAIRLAFGRSNKYYASALRVTTTELKTTCDRLATPSRPC